MVLNCQIVRLESSWRREFKIKVVCLPPPPVFLVYASCFYAVALPPIPFVFFSFFANLPSLDDVLSICSHSCLSCLLPARFLLLGCLLLSSFVPLVITLLIYLQKLCLVMLSQCYETHVYYCWLHLYSGSRQANNNYILISTFIPCMCHRSLHWLQCGNSS